MLFCWCIGMSNLYQVQKIYTKHVTIGADVRTQKSLRVDERPRPSTRLIDLTENAPMNKSGKAKKLQVPIGIEAVNQYKRALMALHEFQVITRGVTWPSPKVTKEVKNIIKQYETNLVYDQVQTNADRAAQCIIRDSYKIGQLGKTLKDGEVNAFAFYMLSKLQEEPAFLDNERWHNFKVLVDKEEGINGIQQYNSTKKIFREHGIFTSRVTHGGRHSGAMEAESLGIPIDSIKKGGGWKDRLGRLETHNQGKVPSEFARGMAGFWNKPFGLERNRVDPPIELQQKIFFWIEEYFGESNTNWKKECLDEMNQIDENEFTEEDAQAEFVAEFVEEDAKENDIINTYSSVNNFFLSPEFILFQEQVKLAINTPTNDRLQEYESLVPHIVGSQNEVSSRIAGFDSQLTQIQQNLQQDIRKELTTSTSSASTFIAPITSSSVASSSRNILPAQAETQNPTSGHSRSSKI
ncbi:hypothetical protein [Parasitella parasitica]|uniref:Uncharacterized protein n=1 Tax=Parasitella parasitica TaxID=35722 RepID=A0A0B7MX83_9FUNG|nr:hypothetical protein [Parasitella parasitica]